MECPKCNSKKIFKRRYTERINFNVYGRGGEQRYFKMKKFVCINCGKEFDIT